MIAINDTNSFTGLDIEQSNATRLIPSSFEINTLISNNAFVNTTITMALKNLLVDISNSCAQGLLASVSQSIMTKASQMYNRIGFYRSTSGIIQFTLNADALNQGTSMIINSLHDFTNYNDKAYNAFHNNSWAKRANDIRGMANSGLKKQHHITVTKLDVNSTIQDINNLANLINNTAVDNRFALISAVPAMPRIKICNNSNVALKVRLKIKFKKTRYANGTGTTYRVFLDHFPDQNSSDHTDTVGGVDIYTKVIPSQGSWEVNYEGKIRGGDATIEYIENSLVWSDAGIYKFTFNIRGRNPVRQNVLNYLNENRPQGAYLDRFWFIMRLIRHESGTHQANEFLHFNIAPNNTYIHNNNQIGMPCFGPPKGFGLGQIDNYGDEITTNDISNLGLTQEFSDIQPGHVNEYQTIVDNQARTIDYEREQVASDDAVWNWKKNIDIIVKVLEEKINMIDDDMEDMRDSVIAWNVAHPTNPVIVPAPINYNSIQFKWIASQIDEFIPYNPLFQQGTSPVQPAAGTRTLKSFFDAMLIKEYNGHSGGGTFMEMTTSGGKPSFHFNVLNSEPFNYVERISNTND